MKTRLALVAIATGCGVESEPSPAPPDTSIDVAPMDTLANDVPDAGDLPNLVIAVDTALPPLDAAPLDAEPLDTAAEDAGPDAATCPGPLELPSSGGLAVAPTPGCPVVVTLAAPRVLAVRLAPADLATLTGAPLDEPGWSHPRVYPAGTLTLTAEATSLSIDDYGPPAAPSVREHSLVWTDSPLVDVCDLACLMAAIAPDGHGGTLFQEWFQSFASTAHSERLGPTLMLEAYADALGPDPAAWDLSVLPFTVTGVHNRFDLHGATHCGELRVSLASQDPLFKPFHLIFLFAMPPGPLDVSPNGTLHCTETALWWARLGELDPVERVSAGAARAAETFRAEHFLAAETLEFLVAPWEWRQWFLDPSGHLVNRPLFQTVDIPAVNAPGPTRDAFLEFVADNADALRDRRMLIPEAFRAPSARVNQGVPWIPLDLTGLPAAAGDPGPLRQAIEQIGCPGCHTADAPFVQTDEQRQFSPFYDKELDARAALLDQSTAGPVPPPPFAPLQPDFLGHP